MTAAERWRRAVDRLAPAAEGWRVAEMWASPGRIEGRVEGPDGRYRTALLVDVVGPQWQARWRRAVVGLQAGAEVALDDPRADRVAAEGGPDPVPGRGGLMPRCDCGRGEGAAGCGHARLLAEAVADALAAGRTSLLALARGLGGDGWERALPRAGAAAGGEGVAPPVLDDQAFWGGGEMPAVPDVPAWQTLPLAVERLGPLPAARGQAAATAPVLAHYRRVRDALAPPGRGARGGRRVGQGDG